jgi:CBS domain-containing protein
MEVGKLCTVDTVCCARDESVQGAALLMRKHHVGDLVVVDDVDGDAIPSGIVTDRDIVVSVVALGLDPTGLQVGDIMSDDLLMAASTTTSTVTIERMRLRGIRRVPVVNRGRAPRRHRQRGRPARLPGRGNGRPARISPYSSSTARTPRAAITDGKPGLKQPSVTMWRA